MSNFQQKAEEMYGEAQKRLTGRGLFEMLFGSGSNRLEQAIEYYVRAGNLFRMAKNWAQAGQAFCDAAKLNSRIEQQHVAANHYVDAANCFRKSQPEEAIKCLMMAINIYTELGKFLLAAKYHKLIAEIMEDDGDAPNAVKHYEVAADYFRSEDSHSNANKCMVKIAEFESLHENYQRAIEIFQEIACFDMASSLLKYSAKDYFFNAAICHLCLDAGNVRSALEYYAKIHPAFEDSREFKFLQTLAGNIEAGDELQFNQTVKRFDSISRLSNWQVAMLLRVKKRFAQPDLR